MSTTNKIDAQLISDSIASKKDNEELVITYGLNDKIVVEGKLDLSPFTKLKKLILGPGIFSILDTDTVKGLPIQELSIDRPLNKERYFNLQNFPNLVNLHIFGYIPLDNLDLTNNIKLEKIELHGETAKKLDLNIFFHLTNLKKLELEYINGSYKALANCQQLEYLKIEGGYHFAIPKEGLEYLDLDRLKYLYLGRQYLPCQELKSSYSRTGVFESGDALGKMLEPYDWDGVARQNKESSDKDQPNTQ
ncbi:6041_t:CDS:2 [Racocetra persica]|uniref:6041_t:CDS:1 n=1 Tax=Racocetra persica TaxID=160502 RepID=A0ACA9ML10_9GLOM|nr:6041_t:CDS:2 [Racocetra persica]